MNKNKTIKETFPVIGMSCAACATRVDKTLNQQKGVHTATVNYAAATATIEYDSSICSVQQLKDAIQGAGYDLLTDTEKSNDIAEAAKKYVENTFNWTGSTQELIHLIENKE